MLTAAHYNGEIIDILLRKCYPRDRVVHKKASAVDLARTITRLRYKSEYFDQLILECAEQHISKQDVKRDEGFYFYILAFFAKMDAIRQFEQLLVSMAEIGAFEGIKAP